MVLGLFGGDKPTEKNIAKQVLKVKERYAQPEYRRVAMEKLLEWATDEALDGVLARFTVVVQSPHWDEEEKRWLVEELVEKGDPARQALSRFLKKENNIAFAAKALQQLSSKETFLQELCDALKARSPEDYRSAQAKQDLIHALTEVLGEKGGDVLVPYLDDHADDVQCAAIEAVEKVNVEAAKERLATMITEDLHSARVLRAAAGAVSRMHVAIDPEKPIEAAVLEDFAVKDGTLARKEAE
jgi:phenylpyruvate tautomerase PptA (4-oxalocrotonate tautomerase family)